MLAATFVITRWWAALIALGAVVALIVVAHLVIMATVDDPAPGVVAERRRGVKALVIGADGRASTSKLQVVLWFFGVFFAFVFLFVWGRSTNCGSSPADACRAATTARAAFRDAVNAPLQPEYFVLLGFPVTAALAAKALTTNKVLNGTRTKPSLDDVAADAAAEPAAAAGSALPPADDATSDPASTQPGTTTAPGLQGYGHGLAEIVTDDNGNADLLDFQYFGFNLVTLAYFVVEFLTHPGSGLPDLPPTLISLAGISAAAYTTKKALETDVRPVVSRVIPDPFALAVGTTVDVIGTGFGSGDESASTVGRKVLLNGQQVDVAADGWSDRRIQASITGSLVAAIAAVSGGVAGAVQSGDIVVIDSDGVESEAKTVSFRT